MTPTGRHVWEELAQPKIRAYYQEILADFSINDVTHTLHYLLKMLENMQRLDAEWHGEDEPAGAGVPNRQIARELLAHPAIDPTRDRSLPDRSPAADLAARWPPWPRS